TLTGGYFPNGQIRFGIAADGLGRTNYLPSAGTIGGALGTPNGFYGKYVGPFYNRSRTGLAKIPDGTSNTVFFGEALGGNQFGTPNGRRDFAYTWMGAGAMATAWGMQNPAQWYTYGSQHPGGITQFAWGDGSVRGVRQGTGATFFTADW